MYFVREGQHDRSLARSAWKSVTQKSRPVGYGLIRAGVRTDFDLECRNFECEVYSLPYETRRTSSTRNTSGMSGIATPDHTVPYGTVLLVGAFPGTSCQATIMLSLWTKYILRTEALMKLALIGVQLREPLPVTIRPVKGAR
jgi:hypothetical protein